MSVTGRGGPYGCDMSRLRHFRDSRLTDGGESNLISWPFSTLQKHFLILISVRV
jgi:hypothetical protein